MRSIRFSILMDLKLKYVSILFILCFSTVTFSYAQVNAVITYAYEDGYMLYKYEYQLIINQQLSKFQHHREATEFTTDDGYFIELSKNYYDWFYDATTKKITEQRVLKDGTKVLATWNADLTWKITEETKEIAGYKVQKAVIQSHDLSGRESVWDDGDAIAWFTTDIPISSGPGRYYGLPGLIVFLEFTDSSITYTLKDIKWDTNKEILIPTEGIRVTQKQTFRFFELLTKKWVKQQKKLQGD